MDDLCYSIWSILLLIFAWFIETGWKWLALSVGPAAMLAGCATIQQQSIAALTLSKSTSLLALGNSITKYGENVSCGWTNEGWGLAAPTLEQDYAHLTGKGLGVPVTAMNVQVEYGLDAVLPTSLPVDTLTDVVIEAGDNARGYTSPEDFGIEYGKLIELIGEPHKLVCTSTFWHFVEYDKVIEQVCEQHNGTYVFIGDIYTSPENTDRETVQFPLCPNVNKHPRQWGHEHIAERIVEALRTE